MPSKNTLLTFDPIAGMAYLYYVPPGVERRPPIFVTQAIRAIDAMADFAEDGRPLGIEFPAQSPENALRLAGEIWATFPHP